MVSRKLKGWRVGGSTHPPTGRLPSETTTGAKWAEDSKDVKETYFISSQQEHHYEFSLNYSISTLRKDVLSNRENENNRIAFFDYFRYIDLKILAKT